MGILITNKTMQIAYGEMVGVIVITLGYFTLIPLYGIYGAAWSTVAGFIARFFWVNWKGKQFYNMQLPWPKVGLVATLALTIYMFTMLSPDQLLMSILYRISLVLIFLVIFFISPVLSKKEKKEIWRITRNLKSRLST
jgi:O-antigen/teichoic acid export membrane protein